MLSIHYLVLCCAILIHICNSVRLIHPQRPNISDATIMFREEKKLLKHFLSGLISKHLPTSVVMEDPDFSKFLKFENASLYKKKTLAGTINTNKTFKTFSIKEKKVSLKRQMYHCVYAHNVIRRKHGLNDIFWDMDLAYNVEEWALTLAARDTGMDHSHMPDKHGLYFGENIYLMQRNEAHSCTEAVNYWYS